MKPSLSKIFPSEFEGPPVTSTTVPPARQTLDSTRREILSLVEMLLQQNSNNIPGMIFKELVGQFSDNLYQEIGSRLLRKTRMFVSDIYRHGLSVLLTLPFV